MSLYCILLTRCWESVALSRRRRLLPIVWVARDVCDFIMVSYQVLNSPRLIYYFSNMTSRLSGNISVFGLVLIVLKSLLETARQCSLEKFTILSLKARSHVTILIHRTWAILRKWSWHKIKYLLLFEFIVETPKGKGKRKKQKSPLSDEGTYLVAEPFCFVKPISYYQDRIKRQDETVVKQSSPGSSPVFPIYWRQTKRVFFSLLPPYCDTKRPRSVETRPGSKSSAKLPSIFLGRNLCLKMLFVN